MSGTQSGVVNLVEECGESAIDLSSPTEHSRKRERLERVDSTKSDADRPKLYKAVRDSLKCTICLELYHRPILLVPCSHVYCGSCFSQWIESQPNLACPQCRSEPEACYDAPKNITVLLEEYLKCFPEESRDEVTSLALESKDHIKRGVKLDGATTQQAPRATITINHAMVSQFMAFTQADWQTAVRIVSGALERGLTLDHAVNYYLSGPDG